MRWTIGMPSYNNFNEVYFTVQSLRLHHDLTDCEIVVVDNYGDKVLEQFCKEKGKEIIRYEKFTDIRGTAAPRDKVFEIAKGEFVLCMDSHVLLKQGFLNKTPIGDGLAHGPCLWNTFDGYSCEWLPQWRNKMWGIWAGTITVLPEEPFEIWGSGLGIFCCRKDSWLGFNKKFRGFGGEEGYIHEKYKKAGRKVWCDPTKVWVHHFGNCGRQIPFPIPMHERVRNYIIGFMELGLDTRPIKEHFGEPLYSEALAKV
jgi:glycosyltransferase involved in cell wall biosynthesis